MSAWLKRAFAASVIVLTATASSAQNSLSAARDLYAAAAYEDALSLLNRLRGTDHHADEDRAIEQYRAFCLLALGRAADATRAIEAVVAADPAYLPSETEVSPRVRSAFRDVRRRMLPAIVRQQYANAKAAFDRKEFAAATTLFTQVLDTLTDPDVAAAADQSPLSDFRTLATSFRDLAAAAAPTPPPPLPSVTLPSVTPPPVPTPFPALAPPSSPSPRRIYGAGDGNVVPPIVVRQSLPSFPTRGAVAGKGSLEVVIDEMGAVESATMKVPMDAAYDRLAIAATKEWRYRPATMDGVPVKYRKIVQVSVKY
jgi:tetratricopeptide (TPR) repeat protein